MSEQCGVRVSIVRGGTSKAIFVRAEDWPAESRPEADELIRAIFGSPDRRQVDGIGGADLLTSKFSIIGPPSRDDADVDYTFVQVGIETPTVSWAMNCGNISAVVGPYAIDEGFVEAVEPSTTVRIHQVNTGRLIVAEVPVRDGAAAVAGDYEINGVPGSGAKVTLDFSDSAGGTTGALLPTGNPVDTLEVEGIGPIEASIVDAANPIVFIRAEDIGLRGDEDPNEIDSDAELMAKLELIRCTGAVAAGFAATPEEAEVDCPTVPFIAFVGKPRPWTDFASGEQHAADECDLNARLYVMRRMHKAYAGTGTICTGAAARIPGSITNQALGASGQEGLVVRIGHPSGVIPIEVEVEVAGHESPVLRRAAIHRTARRLLDGTVYVPRAAYPSKQEPSLA
ncbi:MAG: 3-methylitaconate isomerase [Actinobacteria bacterium]|nr:3-methylitaconate isomerase [Actinomycetota bacterium]